jgi:hypothetical protein
VKRKRKDEETKKKDSSGTMQKKSKALSDNHPNGTKNKNGRPEEASLVKKQVSQVNFERTEIQTTIHHLIPSSAFVGSARPMTSAAKERHQ